MTRLRLRRAVLGLLAGGIASFPLAVTWGHPALSLLLGALGGCLYTLSAPEKHGGESWLDHVFTAAILGVPFWGAFSVVAVPVANGQGPQWTAGGMRGLFPALVGWVLAGGLLGLLAPAGSWLAARLFGPEPAAPPPAPPAEKRRVLILGGGFAGVGTASGLERLFRADPSVEFVLVSETNALLFTPMLTEVAASSLEPTHISSPLRTSLRRTRIVRGSVADIDLEKRCVRVRHGREARRADDEETSELSYDHLVLALGAVADYLGNDAIREHALDFKSLGDAIRVRNAVIAAFDAADTEPDPARRRAGLTFVVAGGGFSGAELAGALNDFARGMLADYPGLPADELRVIVVHSRERILPELSESLAAYALDRMQARGVTFRLNARVTDARPGVVTIQAKGEGAPPEEIAAGTLVWTAGAAPSPVLKALPVEHDRRGAVATDATLAVKGHPGVWALGDCASVPDEETGKPCPGTAQFAVRQAPHLARNLHAALRGLPARPFRFKALGTLCVVGHQTACAEIRGYRFSGFFAWLLWRGIYWVKLPGLERKVRVLGDWLIELVFPRDIVQTIDFGDERGARAAAPSKSA